MLESPILPLQLPSDCVFFPQVKIWFQNRRAKERKQVKKREELLHKEKLEAVQQLQHHQLSGPPPVMWQQQPWGGVQDGPATAPLLQWLESRPQHVRDVSAMLLQDIAGPPVGDAASIPQEHIWDTSQLWRVSALVKDAVGDPQWMYQACEYRLRGRWLPPACIRATPVGASEEIRPCYDDGAAHVCLWVKPPAAK